jgi:hypothetical protein
MQALPNFCGEPDYYYTARLAKGRRYFFFHSGEAAEWLDRTVSVETISSHTVEGWIDEFKRLNKLNKQIMAKPVRKSAGVKRRPS